MDKIRKYLKPLSVLYDEIVKKRNKLYDKGVLKSTLFDIPTIVVGNLSVGGTGKSPQIEYLVRLLQEKYRVAILSRGYKRTTKGFQLANSTSTAEQIGDEPLQFYKKFKNIIVAVDSDRVNGVTQLKAMDNPPDVVLLDDAFQHRKIQGGFNILLTSYHKLYVDDTMLPKGDLRENINGAKRAQIIIVTKCPNKVSEAEQFEITKKLNLENTQTAYFTKIDYANKVISKQKSIPLNELTKNKILLVTGIANTKPLEKFLDNKEIDFNHLKYKDHYHFTNKDIQNIKNEGQKINSEKTIIITTEKDYVRTFEQQNFEVYYLPIKTKFIDFEESFNTKILRYVGQSTGNSSLFKK